MITVDTVNEAYGSISDDSRVTHQIVASLMTVIYDCKLFIVQSTDHSLRMKCCKHQSAASTRVLQAPECCKHQSAASTRVLQAPEDRKG
jgi:hypothetical protein